MSIVIRRFVGAWISPISDLPPGCVLEDSKVPISYSVINIRLGLKG